MTVQKGDTVRCTNAKYTFITEGKEYPVTGLCGEESFYIRDDDGDETDFTLQDGFTVVKSATDDELTELQAWKAKALARFPALEEDETDYEAAERFAERSYSIGVTDMLVEAFKWARENNC